MEFLWSFSRFSVGIFTKKKPQSDAFLLWNNDIESSVMSFLPKKETDILSLIKDGYSVTYSDSNDNFMNTILDLHDCIKESIQKDGIVCAPNGQPAVKYFDKKSEEIVAAAWFNPQGQMHRENAPAFVCERTEETGAYCSYVYLGYLQNGDFHNEAGAAFICDDIEKGKPVRSIEEYYLLGTLIKYIRRDPSTGKIVPEYSSPEYSDSEHMQPKS